jgi:hypothetical protein
LDLEGADGRPINLPMFARSRGEDRIPDSITSGVWWQVASQLEDVLGYEESGVVSAGGDDNGVPSGDSGVGDGDSDSAKGNSDLANGDSGVGNGGSGVGGGGSGALVFRAANALAAGQECYMLYGRYSNAKLLFRCGPRWVWVWH